METAIRITVEHYNTSNNTVLSRKNINEQPVIKPTEMTDLGYRHIEQIQMLHLTLFVRINPMLNAYYHAPCPLQHVA